MFVLELRCPLTLLVGGDGVALIASRRQARTARTARRCGRRAWLQVTAIITTKILLLPIRRYLVYIKQAGADLYNNMIFVLLDKRPPEYMKNYKSIGEK